MNKKFYSLTLHHLCSDGTRNIVSESARICFTFSLDENIKITKKIIKQISIEASGITNILTDYEPIIEEINEQQFHDLRKSRIAYEAQRRSEMGK